MKSEDKATDSGYTEFRNQSPEFRIAGTNAGTRPTTESGQGREGLRVKESRTPVAAGLALDRAGSIRNA